MDELLQQQGWNTTDFVAAVTLIVTVVDLGFTVWNTYQTSKRTEEVSRSSLRSTLEIPRDPYRIGKHNEFTEAGLMLSQLARLIDHRPRVQFRGTVQSIGRYAATHIELSDLFSLTRAENVNAPWDILESLSGPSDFDLLFLLTPPDPDDLESGLGSLFRSGPLWITIGYRDGNPGTQLYGSLLLVFARCREWNMVVPKLALSSLGMRECPWLNYGVRVQPRETADVTRKMPYDRPKRSVGCEPRGGCHGFLSA